MLQWTPLSGDQDRSNLETQMSIATMARDLIRTYWLSHGLLLPDGFIAATAFSYQIPHRIRVLLVGVCSMIHHRSITDAAECAIHPPIRRLATVFDHGFVLVVASLIL